MRSITGCGVCGSNSVEFAPASPHTSRANSMTAQCSPRQRPRNGTLVLAGVAGGRDLALDAADAEAAGDHDAVEVAQPAFGEQAFGVVGRDPVDLDLRAARVAAVLQRLDHREVRVGQVDVLADEADAHRPASAACTRSTSARHSVRSGSCSVEVQHAADVVVEAFVVEHERDLVEDVGVDRRDDALLGHVAELRRSSP